MPTPNFEDAPDGSSSVYHTGSVLSEESPVFWEDIDPWADIPSHPPQLRDPAPHPSYADGSAPLMTATEVNEARRRAEWRPIPAVPPNPNPVGYSRDFLPPCSPPRQSLRRTATEELREALSAPPRRRRRGSSDPDAAIRKDPNAWSLREAVELCKLLEVVLPEAGFHIALTGGLLYKEGRRKDCDLMFYQIRQVDPNYEVLWKYLTVAGVIRSPSYPENGWLVKATYRGKAIDCLFPNAKKAKKVVGGEVSTKQNAYQTSPPPPPTPDMEPPMTATEVSDSVAAARLAFVEANDRAHDFHRIYREAISASQRAPAPVPSHAVGRHNTAIGANSLASNNAGTFNTEIGESVLVRHNDGAPIIYHRIPEDLAEFLATTDPAPVPAAAEAQDDIPF